MKIIIDIPENVYNHCKTINDYVYQAIANGTPLDDIKAEIIEHSYPVCYDKYSIEKGMTLTGIMQAFDKHIGKESE